MAINFTPEPVTDNPVETYLQNPQNKCLAYRNGRWTVIPTTEARAGFLGALVSLPTTVVKTINSVQLCFESNSLDRINQAFKQTVNLAKTQQSLEDEGFVQFTSTDLVDDTSDPASLLESLSQLKSDMSDNPRIIPAPDIIARYESAISRLDQEDPTIISCQFFLRAIKRMEASRQTPSQASLEAQEIARQAEKIADARRSLTIIVDGTKHHLEAALITIRGICTAECDKNTANSIYDQTQDIARYPTAEFNLAKKYADLEASLIQLADNMHQAEEAIATVLEREELARDDSNIKDLVEGFNYIFSHMNALKNSFEEKSQKIIQGAELTFIKNRFQQRKEILQRASQALRSYTGKTPVLLSMQNGALVVEEKPFTTFLRKDIETLSLPNGLQVACKKESIENLNNLFALAVPKIPNAVSDRYLLGVREEFCAALASKTK